MTAMGRPALNLIPGGLSIVPTAPRSPTENAARSASRVVAAAQQWATLMIETGHADQLTQTDLGQATLALLDSVNEYEGHSAGIFPGEQQQGPAATLW